jgi:penicillin-binding protein 2
MLDLRQALAESCDVYFYEVASRMKIDTIHDYAEKLGLVGKTGIDLPNEAEGVIPSTEWKQRTAHDRWYPGETISVGIGQGPVTVTPIELATMISAIANGGTIVTPHVVKAVSDGQGWQSLEAPQPRSIFPIRPDVIAPVREGLWRAVNDARGTAYGAARIAGHDVVGKTGTAQVVSLDNAAAAKRAGLNTKDNSWFVFYTPADHPTVAGAIFAEHGGFGADSAAPIAKYVLETYFAKTEGRPLPTVKAGPGGSLVIEPARPAAPAASGPEPAKVAQTTAAAGVDTSRQ